jgi:hypothetical protein
MHIRKSHLLPALYSILAIAALSTAAIRLWLPERTFSASIPAGETRQVIVTYRSDLPDATPDNLPQRADLLAQTADPIIDRVSASSHLELVQQLDHLPILIVETDATGLAELARDHHILDVTTDVPLELSYRAPLTILGGDLYASYDDTAVPAYPDDTHLYTGRADPDHSYEIVVIDTGADAAHQALSGKIATEACFGINVIDVQYTISPLCPSGATTSTAAGASQDCTLSGCGHGTQTAAAAVMDRITLTSGATSVVTSGAAPGAQVIPIKVVSKFTTTNTATAITNCGNSSTKTCAVPYLSSIYAALNHTLTLATTHDRITAVNLSLGTGAGATTSTCRTIVNNTEYENFYRVIRDLRSLGIATFVSNGNDGQTSQGTVTFPACVEGAIAVGATGLVTDSIAYYSQNGPLTTLLAPGGAYNGTVDSRFILPANGTTNSFTSTQGTSFASPTAAGAYAVLRSKYPLATIDQLIDLLTSTGTLITDTRSGFSGIQKPLINLAAALSATSDPLATDYPVTDGYLFVPPATSADTLLSNLSSPFELQLSLHSAAAFTSGPTPYSTTVTDSPHGWLASSSEPVHTGANLTLLSHPLGQSTTTYPIVVRGDINGDGEVDITDSLRVRQHIAAVRLIADIASHAADINTDGEVDITDSLRIRQHIAEIREITP